jgi:hypothetical protein
MIKVLSQAEIERRATALLHGYSRSVEPIKGAPIPVEDILERHLKLSLGFEDLGRLLGRRGALGASWVENREVVIDHSLDPESNPKVLGRFRFTVAHEIGHWVLHLTSTRDRSTAPQLLHSPASAQRDPRERQADRFAACLLMPRKLMAWHWKQVGEMAEGPTAVDPSQEMARRFQVSEEAMWFRLEDLGLLQP